MRQYFELTIAKKLLYTQSMKRILIFLILSVFLFGCDLPNSADEELESEYLVVAVFENNSFGNGFDVSVYVSKDGSYYETDLNMLITGDSVTDAQVSINSESVPYGDFNSYALEEKDWSAGDTVSVSITHGDFTVSGSIQVPANPVVTSPGASDTFASGAAVPISWQEITPAPDELEIRVPWMSMLADDGSALWEVLSGTATSYTIPANNLDTSVFFGAEVNVNSINRVP